MQRGKASVNEVPVRFCESSKRRDSAANFVDDKVWEIGKRVWSEVEESSWLTMEIGHLPESKAKASVPD